MAKQATNGQATGDGAVIGNATGGTWTGEDLPMNYHQRMFDAHEIIMALVGAVDTRGNWIWTVVFEHHINMNLSKGFLG